MTERELFENWYEENNDFMINTQFLMEGDRYLDRCVRMLWAAWQASANRQGYKLVPVEPTTEMLIAGDNCEIDGKVTAHNIYKAMIGAIE